MFRNCVSQSRGTEAEIDHQGQTDFCNTDIEKANTKSTKKKPYIKHYVTPNRPPPAAVNVNRRVLLTGARGCRDSVKANANNAGTWDIIEISLNNPKQGN